MLGMLKQLIKKLRKKSVPAYWSGSDSANTQQAVAPMVESSWTNYYIGGTQTATSLVVGNSIGNPGNSKPEEIDKREAKKPVEVVGEIVGEKPALMLDHLDDQIKIVKKRIRILEEQSIQCRDEMEAVGYLKARTRYKKTEKLFVWPITTNEKIQVLCSKYKVQKVNFAGYYKNVPNEALDELEKYTKAYSKVRSDAPNLSLIVDQGGKETKKDPILLATSPFGRWYYILGAWDKEVAIVDDLIYNGK